MVANRRPIIIMLSFLLNSINIINIIKKYVDFYTTPHSTVTQVKVETERDYHNLYYAQ